MGRPDAMEVAMFPPDVPTADVSGVPAGAVLLDVREDDEWAAGHAPSAVHIPLGELPARHGELAAEQEVYVICRSGGRSARAVAWLNGNGYTSVNVAGGMGAWQASGLQMVSETGEAPAVR
jgi:rhodanese-related sulfurtransferase